MSWPLKKFVFLRTLHFHYAYYLQEYNQYCSTQQLWNARGRLRACYVWNHASTMLSTQHKNFIILLRYIWWSKWRAAEILALIKWLRKHKQKKQQQQKQKNQTISTSYNGNMKRVYAKIKCKKNILDMYTFEATTRHIIMYNVYTRREITIFTIVNWN